MSIWGRLQCCAITVVCAIDLYYTALYPVLYVILYTSEADVMTSGFRFKKYYEVKYINMTLLDEVQYGE